MSDLKIRIIGTLNQGATIAEINRALKTIEKKAKKIDIRINTKFDNKAINNIQKQLNAIQKNVTSKQSKIISNNDIKNSATVYKNVEEAVKAYSKLGTVKTTQTFNPQNTKEVQKFTLAVTNAVGQIEKYNFALKNGTYSQTGKKVTDNTQAQKEKQLQQEEKINNTINQRKQKLQEELELYKRIANLQYNKATSSGKVISSDQQAALDRYIASVNSLNRQSPNVSSQMRNLQLDFRNVNQSIQQANAHVNTFGSGLQTSLARGMALGALYSGIYGLANGFKTMAQNVVTVDSAMTDLRRVMDLPEYKFNDLLRETIDLSNELANKVTDVFSIQQKYGQAGFTGTDLTNLTKTTQVLQNISDLSADDAVNTLLSSAINFDVPFDRVMDISDKLNEVD